MQRYELIRLIHVLVMGYWIGSDLVINPLAHFTTRASGLRGVDRDRLWTLLMRVDQHPRNALILSLPLGLTLAASLGLSALRGPGLVVAWLLAAGWFGQMWLTHLRGATPRGPALRAWDWRIRGLVIAACLVSGGTSLWSGWPFAARWLAAKVLLFAAVIGCGLGIRHYLTRYVALWPTVIADRATPEVEQQLRTAMSRATAVLVLLHALLWAIALLGALKPF